MILSLLFILIATETQAEQLVETLSGPVTGEDRWGWDSRFNIKVNYTAYVGIPYGEPPVGENRFLPPKPRTKWTNPRSALLPEDRECTQLGINRNSSLDEGLFLSPWSDEDCLILNIYKPRSSSKDLLPVMVWMHGGAFIFGSKWGYGPVTFLAHDIIVVSINYRLGPLGFLSLGTEYVPGNAGLFDQRLALEWVQQNIDKFGGDPRQVTLAGQSAGSFGATYHLFSPGSEGLFQRVIGQSGAGGFSPAYHHYTGDQAARYGHKAAQLLGCGPLFNHNNLQTANCLRNTSAELIQMMDLPMELMTQPVVDGDYNLPDHNPFLPLNPLHAILTGDYNTGVDILYGATKDEGQLLSQFLQAIPALYPFVSDQWDIIGPFLLFARHHTETTDEDIELADKVLNFYVGSRENINEAHRANLTDMISDAFFWYGIDTFLSHHVQHSHGANYQYIIEHKGVYHFRLAPGLQNEDMSGMGHADELYLEWDPYNGNHLGLPADDLAVSRFITTLWSNFVKYGDPTQPHCRESQEDVPCNLGVTWEPRTDINNRYMVMDTDLRMEQSANYRRRMSFWSDIWTIH